MTLLALAGFALTIAVLWLAVTVWELKRVIAILLQALAHRSERTEDD